MGRVRNNRALGPWIEALLVGVVWVLAASGDWWMRFRWYRWQDRVVLRRGVTEKGPYAPMLVLTNPAVRGGDLTTLMGTVPGADRFKEWKAAATNWTDEFGFRNVPPTGGRTYPVVVAGDSFMTAGPRMEDTFPGRLELLGGIPVYNYAYDGRGSLRSPLLLLTVSDRFRAAPPRLVIWGILEREVSAANFAHVRRQAARNLSAGTAAFCWEEVVPHALKRSLPDTSAISQLAAKTWGRLRVLLIGGTAPAVVEASGRIAGKEVLFYGPGVETLLDPPADRGVDVVAEAAIYIQQLCREQGSELLIVLIPDKEQVYREYIAGLSGAPDESISSVLNELESRLRSAAVPVMNLLTPFRTAARGGRLLYWTDDTHWNTEGVDLAVQCVLPELRRYIAEDAANLRDQHAL